MREVKEGVIITLAVKPGSSKTKFPSSINNDFIGIQVQSPADKGKANKEVVKVLQKFFKNHCRSVELVGGLTSRTKQVLLRNAELKSIHALLFKE